MNLISKESMFITGQDGQIVVAPNVLDSIRALEVQKKQIEKDYKKFKEVLLSGMEEYGLKKVDTDELLITYVEPTERVSIDTKKLYKEYPNVAFACEKDSPVKASVRITVR